MFLHTLSAIADCWLFNMGRIKQYNFDCQDEPFRLAVRLISRHYGASHVYPLRIPLSLDTLRNDASTRILEATSLKFDSVGPK